MAEHDCETETISKETMESQEKMDIKGKVEFESSEINDSSIHIETSGTRRLTKC